MLRGLEATLGSPFSSDPYNSPAKPLIIVISGPNSVEPKRVSIRSIAFFISTGQARDSLLSWVELAPSPFMDYYRTLGLSRDATKEEIKEAYRRSALDYHPDRHTQSSGEIRDRAALRFKQASEAYQVLVDDRKRADYDLSRHQGRGFGGWSSGASSGPTGPGYSGRGYGYGGGGGVDHARRSAGGVGSAFYLGALFKFMSTRGFLMSIAFASLLLGGVVLGDRSVEKLWKINNMGKSFEEAMVSIEKVRVQKEDNIESQGRT